jgi:sugar O-acyltransferase (sialic acid O-acetyltransferase NeuD family)
MTLLLGVYGSGGCGRGILPLLRSDPRAADARIVFIDDHSATDLVNGHPVWSFARFVEEPAVRRGACLAVANSRVREQLDRKCRDAAVDVIGVRAPNVVEMVDVEIGPGGFLSPFVTITSNVSIGRCFHANLYSYVEHDCRIGDYVTFAPAVHCNGNVHVGDHAYVGTGAFLRQGTPKKPLVIGAGAIIGMGAVVIKDVPEGVTVVGNPARPLIKD